LNQAGKVFRLEENGFKREWIFVGEGFLFVICLWAFSGIRGCFGCIVFFPLLFKD